MQAPLEQGFGVRWSKEKQRNCRETLNNIEHILLKVIKLILQENPFWHFEGKVIVL